MRAFHRSAHLLLIFLFSFNLSVGQTITWYRFDKTFISNHYNDSAIGDITTTAFHPAGSVHSTSCGGDDGELHIGFRLPEVDLPSSQMPLTAPRSGSDPNWGMVAELPNAASGNGPSLLGQLAGMSVTFRGFFRVWDEGHGTGASPASNPHHVFEVHPAWGFDGGSIHFLKKNLVRSMAGFSGYGATKFKPMFKAFNDGTWPLAFQDGQQLHLGLVKNSNFYQLPVKVKSVHSLSGGKEFTVDVFSNQAMTNSVYQGLTVITVTGSPINGTLAVGQKVFLLGFFSVNLKKAMQTAQAANSQSNAVSVKGAVEFFTFGLATQGAVSTCN